MNRLVVAPLVYFHVDVRENQFPALIPLDGGYEIKPLDTALLDPVFNFHNSAFSEDEKALLRRCTHAIYYEFDAEDNNLPENIVQDIYRITQTMRLIIRTRTVPAILMLRQNPSGTFADVDGMSYQGIRGIEISYIGTDTRMEHFNAGDIPELQRYWTIVKALWEAHGGQYHRVLNALIFYELGHQTRMYKPRLVNLVTALESLFNTGSEQITYAIKQRCSYFLEMNPTRRIPLANNIKEIYKLRSLFVHGQATPGRILRNDNTQKQLLMDTEDIVRNCIRKIFDNNLIALFGNETDLNQEFTNLELGAPSQLT